MTTLLIVKEHAKKKHSLLSSITCSCYYMNYWLFVKHCSVISDVQDPNTVTCLKKARFRNAFPLLSFNPANVTPVVVSQFTHFKGLQLRNF